MWTPTPVEKKVKYFVTYRGVTGQSTTIGPLQEEAAKGMISEWVRFNPSLEVVLEEWEPVRAFRREKVA